MADPVFTGGVAHLGNLIIAVGGLGTAAFGLVDSTKAWGGGGLSNVGYSRLQAAFSPFLPILRNVLARDPMETIHANWVNGVATADQKATAKSLIRLGLTPDTAAAMAKETQVNAEALKNAANNINEGKTLTSTDLNVLGRMDAMVSAMLDAAYEHADQQYRNVCKAAALGFAVLLSWLAAVGIAAQSGDWGGFWHSFLLATLIGLVATPLAPVAKDAASSLQAAAAALSAMKP
jgi:hypothetical protein